MAVKTDAEIREDAALSNKPEIRLLAILLHLLEHIDHAVVWGRSHPHSETEHPEY